MSTVISIAPPLYGKDPRSDNNRAVSGTANGTDFYREYIKDRISALCPDPSHYADSYIISLTDACTERMRNEPEYESTVIESIRRILSQPSLPHMTELAGACHTVIKITDREDRGTVSVNFTGRSIYERDDEKGFWEKREERREELDEQLRKRLSEKLSLERKYRELAAIKYLFDTSEGLMPDSGTAAELMPDISLPAAELFGEQTRR